MRKGPHPTTLLTLSHSGRTRNRFYLTFQHHACAQKGTLDIKNGLSLSLAEKLSSRVKGAVCKGGKKAAALSHGEDGRLQGLVTRQQPPRAVVLSDQTRFTELKLPLCFSQWGRLTDIKNRCVNTDNFKRNMNLNKNVYTVNISEKLMY